MSREKMKERLRDLITTLHYPWVQDPKENVQVAMLCPRGPRRGRPPLPSSKAKLRIEARMKDMGTLRVFAWEGHRTDPYGRGTMIDRCVTPRRIPSTSKSLHHPSPFGDGSGVGYGRVPFGQTYGRDDKGGRRSLLASCPLRFGSSLFWCSLHRPLTPPKVTCSHAQRCA